MDASKLITVSALPKSLLIQAVGLSEEIPLRENTWAKAPQEKIQCLISYLAAANLAFENFHYEGPQIGFDPGRMSESAYYRIMALGALALQAAAMAAKVLAAPKAS